MLSERQKPESSETEIFKIMKQLGNTILHPEVLKNGNSLLGLWTEVTAEQIWPLLTEWEMQPLSLVLASAPASTRKSRWMRRISNSGKQRKKSPSWEHHRTNPVLVLNFRFGQLWLWLTLIMPNVYKSPINSGYFQANSIHSSDPRWENRESQQEFFYRFLTPFPNRK